MKITKEILANEISKFLNDEISKLEFVQWAESAMIESDYQEQYSDVISETLAKIGLIDVDGFELPNSFYAKTLLRLNIRYERF